MLDRRFIVENADLVKQNCRRRGVEGRRATGSSSWKPQRKRKQVEVEELNRQANEVCKSIGKAKDAAEREARKDEGRHCASRRPRPRPSSTAWPPRPTRSSERSPTCRTPTRRSASTTRRTSNSAAASTPPPKFDFKPLDHVELAEKLDLVDFEAGAKVAGHGFYFLKNDAVLLELALQRYALDVLMARRLYADDHARPGPQRNPARHRLHSPRAGDADLQHRRQRPEPGGHGRDHARRAAGRTRSSTPSGCRSSSAASAIATAPRPAPTAGRPRGLYRVHQFTKVEMFAFTLPDAERRDARLLLRAGMPAVRRPGHSLSRGRHGHRRPGRAGLSQVRPRSLDARPRRSGRVWRSDQHLQLHRLPGPAAGHPLPHEGRKGDRTSSTRSTARPSPSAGR